MSLRRRLRSAPCPGPRLPACSQAHALRPLQPHPTHPPARRPQAKHDFAAFIAKYFREEVQVLTHPHGPGPLLELRPFGAGAGGPGFPRLDPPFPRPCAAERCAHGEKCRFAHAQPRPY